MSGEIRLPSIFVVFPAIAIREGARLGKGTGSRTKLYSVGMSARKIFLLVVLLLGIPASLLWVRHLKRLTITVEGAVITSNPDPRKQEPIGGVHVTAEYGTTVDHAVSDASGLFTFTFRKRLLLGKPMVKLTFEDPSYQPLRMTVLTFGNITVAQMVPIPRPRDAVKLIVDHTPQQTIANVVVRYSIKSATEVNVGSVVRTFEVANKGNVPCNGASLCSPNGKWKASRGTLTIDAGAGDQFRNSRASCIAGPCPFTKIDTSGLEKGGRTVKVSAMTWSETATFLLEAEVVHPMVSDLVRNSYPVIFGNALNFTLPPAAEGVSIQADLEGQSIVFPLGPLNLLSWANCNERENPDQTRVYRCELKPGYRWLNASS